MPPVLFWLFFFTLCVAYLMGVASVLISQYFGRRSLARRIQDQEEEKDEGYTLRVVRSPGDPYDDDADEEV